jgi:hypothetical protein
MDGPETTTTLCRLLLGANAFHPDDLNPAVFSCRRDNSRDNKRTVQCVQIVSARGKIPAYGPYGRFDHTPDKVEGLVRVLPGGGSSPLGRMKTLQIGDFYFRDHFELVLVITRVIPKSLRA